MRCNEQIRISPVRVIGDSGELLGVMDNREALRLAREAGLDLVEVSPNERPPVCKIIDYGKFKYNQKKNQKKHHEQQLKELRIRPKTDDHDRDIKMAHALRFLKEGDKVQFKMVFRGRERAHREIGHETFAEIIQHFGELAKIERAPVMDGRDMIMILAPNKPALDRLIESERKSAGDGGKQRPDKPGEKSADKGAGPQADHASAAAVAPSAPVPGESRGESAES